MADIGHECEYCPATVQVYTDLFWSILVWPGPDDAKVKFTPRSKMRRIRIILQSLPNV